MKTIKKLSLITATLAVFSTTTAFADNQQMQKQMALQRAQNAQKGQTTTTVAVYANERGVGRSETQAARSELRFERRSNAHGEAFGAYTPAKR